MLYQWLGYCGALISSLTIKCIPRCLSIALLTLLFPRGKVQIVDGIFFGGNCGFLKDYYTG